jgi:aminopeptidase N
MRPGRCGRSVARNPGSAVLAGVLLVFTPAGAAPLPGAAAAVVQPQEPAPQQRLPTAVYPTHYWLALEVVPEHDTFQGTVDIAVEVQDRRDVIWLHGRDMKVSEASVQVVARNGASSEGAGGKDALPVLRAQWQPTGEEGLVALRLPEPVGPGQVRLHIVYEAPFNRRILGLYRVDVGGLSYAFSDFEPCDARFMFPGFDEPSFKAPYDVTLTVPEKHVAVANTRAIGEEALPGGLKRVRFATTEPLPTYLVAIAVGPFDVGERGPIPPNAVRSKPLPFRCIAAHGRGKELAYALEHTPAIVAKLEEYFGIAYPFDKLDLIAVPDYAAGAMENAGLITFREERLLLDEATAAESLKRRIQGIEAHELAHMWFGDTVTMAWWDDLWLNEGFATWMGERTIEALHPDWHIDVSRVESRHGAMRVDSLASARQVRQPIESHHDIQSAFDGITYTKGASLLAMFERWIGPETFQRGIRSYVATHRFGNATVDDLMAALSQASGKDVAAPARTFLQQPGVPLVEAQLVCGGDKPHLSLRQSRSLPVGSSAERDRLWQIPVCARYGTGEASHETCTLLAEKEGRLDLEGGSCPAWVMPNAAAAGYYRWSLAAPDREALRTEGWKHMTAAERLSWSESLEAAFASAAMPASEVFAAIGQLAQDEDRGVATAPIDLLEFAREYLADEALRPRVEAFARSLYGPMGQKLGWEARTGEDGEAKLLRAKVLDCLAFVGRDPQTLAEAARRGKAYLGLGTDGALHPEAVDPDLIETALAAAAQEGGAPGFDAMLKHLKGSVDAAVRVRMLRALGSAITPELAARARDLALDQVLRVNEVLVPLEAQTRWLETRNGSWTWTRDHFDAISARLGAQLVRAMTRLPAKFCDASTADAVQAFFGPRVDRMNGGPRGLANTVESIRLCAARVAAQKDSARSFFERQAP